MSGRPTRGPNCAGAASSCCTATGDLAGPAASRGPGEMGPELFRAEVGAREPAVLRSRAADVWVPSGLQGGPLGPSWELSLPLESRAHGLDRRLPYQGSTWKIRVGE